MRTRLFKSVLSLSFVAMLSCPLAMPSMVICVADCGHVAIEPPEHDSCHHHGDHLADDRQPAEHEHKTNDCEDIALVMVNMTRPDIQMPVELTGEITWIIIDTDAPAQVSNISLQNQKPPPQSDCIRSVVLIV